jgi:hypothetical protein
MSDAVAGRIDPAGDRSDLTAGRGDAAADRVDVAV